MCPAQGRNHRAERSRRKAARARSGPFTVCWRQALSWTKDWRKREQAGTVLGHQPQTNHVCAGTRIDGRKMLRVIRIVLKRDCFLFIVPLAALVTVFVACLRLPFTSPIWVGVQFGSAGFLCPFLAVFTMRNGYLFARRLLWLSRQKRERSEVQALRIPPEIPHPRTFIDVAEIDAAQHRILHPIPDAQGKYRARAVTIYSAPALAVLFSALQQAGWQRGPFAAGLIFSQTIIVLLVLLRILIDKNPTAEWIEQRTRGELLRREQYLCLARAGPYHDAGPNHHVVRVARIENASHEVLTDLVRMEHLEARYRDTWLESLSSRPHPISVIQDLPNRVSCYNYYRAGKQIAWMRSARRDCEGSARTLTWIIGFVTVATAVVASGNAFGLLMLPENGPPTDWVIMLRHAIVFGMFLPVLSGTVLALQSVFNLRMLTENYRTTETTLDQLRGLLIALNEDVIQGWSSSDEVWRREMQRGFQSLVLRVESTLTDEYLRWRLITQRDAHELG